MPAVRVRKGRVALTLASISVLLLILISSGHVWNTSRDEKYPDLKAYASSLRNRYPGWTSKDEDTFRKTSDYPQEQLSGSGTDRGPDGYVDTEEEDDEDFGVRYPNGKLEPVPHDGLTDSHAVGLPGHHVGLPTGKGSAEAGAALLLDEKPGSPAEDASVREQPKNKDDTEQMSTTSTSTTTSTPSKIHWTQFPEHYPVPTESLITLPPGTPKKMPKIQHTFGVESAEDKLDRENKLTIIKAAFNRTWSAYREYAWTHDELAPVQAASENSKYAFRDPFGGWGATLVDSLDTLWLMGMTEEFDEAVEATMSIDFTTVAREDIPIFETTIRYVGGLIGAYDLSGRKELITKCVELAGIIMAAFDTPNRMPNLYYHWKPQFASVPRRASSSVCLAEMGSLSLEFTRLAQITGDQKYYDAIARITDNFEDFQNRTSVPGLWPLSFDASGCANPWTQQEMQKNGLVDPRKDESSFGADSETNTKSKPASAVGPDARKDQSSFGDDSSASNIERRQVRQEGATTVTGAGLGDIDSSSTDRSVFVAQIEEKMAAMPTKKYPKPISSCLPFDGFQSVQRDEYALGGRADSTYEYLPKQWLLLGGLNDQYKSMYEHALAASKEYLLFRPMINDTANMTFSGTFDVKLGGKIDKNGRPEGYLNPKTGHLNCFVGGMVGLAARAFGHEEDMELAEQLAESCAWAYRITASGVMPEDFTLLPCPKPGRCEWNETYWKHELDPAWASREGMIAKWGVDESERIMKQEEADKLAAAAKLEADNDSDHDEKQEEAEKLAAAAGLEDEHSDNENHVSNTASKTATSDIVRRRPPGTLPDTARVLGATHGQHPKNDAGATSPSKTIGAAPENNFKLTFPKPLTHEQFVQGKITREKLYPGVTNMNDKRYLLRPEAIESIFYLHRLTGNPIWRRHGWDMFLAVERLSRTALAYSSVLDVTMPETPYHQGVMESFWTAETLKYFWLLFEGEEVMDLGEWVLNTEAHGFRLSI